MVGVYREGGRGEGVCVVRARIGKGEGGMCGGCV